MTCGFVAVCLPFFPKYAKYIGKRSFVLFARNTIYTILHKPSIRIPSPDDNNQCENARHATIISDIEFHDLVIKPDPLTCRSDGDNVLVTKPLTVYRPPAGLDSRQLG
jgi:hypothetical protein